MDEFTLIIINLEAKIYEHKKLYGVPPESLPVSPHQLDVLLEGMKELDAYRVGTNEPIPERPLFMGVSLEVVEPAALYPPAFDS